MQRFARGPARAMLAFCLCGVAFGALAQGPDTPPLDPAPVAGEAAPALSITRVDLGFGGALVPERWQPVVVWLFSERAIEGVVSLEYLQDGSQRARVEVAFATTPGRAIPVELACAPPQRLDRLTLRVRGGPRELRRVYAEFPGENEEQFTLRSGGELIALSLGDTAVEEAIGAWSNVTVNQLEIPGAVPPLPPMYVDRGSSTAPALDAAAQWRQRVRAMKVDPAGAPLAWLAYDAASVVIVRAVTLGSMDVRRRSALMTWVESGGRLIVLMDPGTAWTNAAASPGAPLPVEAGEIRALEPIDSQVGADGDSAAFGVLDARLRPREIAGRAMVLTPQGMHEGWRLGWRVTPRSGERGAGGLLATGPVGMGIVTLLGIEPRLVPVMLDGSATGRLWEQVLVGDEVGILPQFKRPSAGFDADQMQWWYRGSGEDVAGADGIAAALDMTARGLAVPDGVFVLVGLSMVALALLVGPGDFFLLRRRGLGGRTWIAAIGWTGLATAGAYFLPGLLQTSGSSLRRIEIVDVIATGPEAPGEPQLPARAYELGISGLFTVGSGAWQERDDGIGGRWWRGISSTSMGYGSGSGSSLLEATRVRLAGSEGDVALRRTALADLANPQWTFRGLMDMSPGHDRAWKVRVISKDDQGCVVRVEGLRPGMRVASAALTVPWGLATASKATEGEAASSGEAATSVDLEFELRPKRERGVPDPASAGFRVLSSAENAALSAAPRVAPSLESAAADVSFDALAGLPSVRERDAAIERRVHASGDGDAARLGYACLYLSIVESGDGASASLPLAVAGRMEHTRRMLVRAVFDWPLDAAEVRGARGGAASGRGSTTMREGP